MLRKLKLTGITLAALAGFGAIAAYWVATASLARHEGTAILPGLAAPADIEFDARAVPRIRTATLTDAFRAQGFLHAQERFFQMDLIRRSAAGELTALVGERALRLDRAQAAYEFRRRAQTRLGELPPLHRSWLEAYAAGVNAGLDDLGARPPEYWLLGQAPTPWRPEDSLLTIFAVYTMLSNNEYYERPQSIMAATLPAQLFEFLTPTASRDDRPLLAPASDPTGGYQPAPLPDAATVDLRKLAGPLPSPSIVDPPMMGQAASNQWAVAAGRTANGFAMLANDPHLGFQVPNLFYRVELYWSDQAVRGVSVPGLPGVLIGANADLAWGATVSYADQSDWVLIDTDPEDPTRYLTPDGAEPFDVETVRIGAGDAVEDVEIRRTRFGPVVDTDGFGRPLALKATWLEPDGLSLDLLELGAARSTADAFTIIDRWSGPALSWSIAAADGTVAWIVNGPIPARTGFDGSTPVSWSDGTRHWSGFLTPPRIHRGVGDIVMNANNRALSLPEATGISRMYMRPHRAARIADLLAGRMSLDEAALFGMQLDTAAAAYEPIREIVLTVVPADESDPALAGLRQQVLDWNGRADSAGLEFLTLQRIFRGLLSGVLAPLLAPAVAADPTFVYRWPLAEEAMLRLIEEQPAHLLPGGYNSWDTYLRQIFSDTITAGATAPDESWGAANRLTVGHPLAGIPVVGRWLRAPAETQSGSPVSIRVATPSRGAVFRMVVSPAAPANGILQMFGGQSGHFLSANFMDQQHDWAHDVPTPFLAGPTVASIRLLPESPVLRNPRAE